MGEKEGRTIEGSTQPSTERELLGRLCARDTAAFALLYDRHAPMVFGAAIRLLSGSPEAERAVEQIFLALWRGAPGLDAARTPVRPWLLAQLVQPGAPWAGGRAGGARGLDTPILAVDAPGDALGRR